MRNSLTRFPAPRLHLFTCGRSGIDRLIDGLCTRRQLTWLRPEQAVKAITHEHRRVGGFLKTRQPMPAAIAPTATGFAAAPVGKIVHVILDNYGPYKHPKTRSWLDRHPRFIFHCTPTSCSWLNAVEGYFAKLNKRRSKTRHLRLDCRTPSRD
jgi:hypothetical protein